MAIAGIELVQLFYGANPPYNNNCVCHPERSEGSDLYSLDSSQKSS